MPRRCKVIVNLTCIKTRIVDLPSLIELLLEDELGQTRESKSTELDKNYIKAFHKIDSDPNQYLIVIENDDYIIGTYHISPLCHLLCHLSLLSAAHDAIEAVKVAGKI